MRRHIKKNNAKNEITLFNQEKVALMSCLNIDSDGTASLTGLWKYAGSPKNMSPNDWSRTEQGDRFIKSVCKIQNTVKNRIIKSKRGKGGGTYGSNQIVLEYAKYLDTDLSVLVNEVFLQRIEEEKNPDLIVDRAIATYKKTGKSNDWIAKRLKGKARRNEFTACLMAHGVNKEGFRNCTNAIYDPLWGGTTAVVREKKNLDSKDNMDETELLAVEFAEHLSKLTIEGENLNGNAQCEIASKRSARIVANALMQNNKKL